ncbi:MAG: GTP cyclohydrolase I FolE [Gammaproteobacteria bacterium]
MSNKIKQAANIEVASAGGATPADSGLRPEAILVRDALLKRGLETPMIANDLSDEEKKAQIESHFREIMNIMGLDLRDDSLTETPQRIAKMYVHEIFGGLDYRNFPKLTVIENKMQVDEMIKVCDIDLSSTCEHHFVTIDGEATVAYIPREKVVGLSKINRIVRFFAQRPQVQERLTEQVLLALQTLLQTDDVAVSMSAVHFCVKARGVMDSNSSTTTTALGGVFKSQPETRREFLLSIS